MKLQRFFLLSLLCFGFAALFSLVGDWWGLLLCAAWGFILLISALALAIFGSSPTPQQPDHDLEAGRENGSEC